MNPTAEDNVMDISKKVQKLHENTSLETSIMLPKQKWEPFFMKVVSDFKKYHNLPDNIPPPQGNMSPHKLMSYIAELMSHSMGEEKRKSLMEELKIYKQDLPFDLRQEC